ncbi:hypothetical protein UFOVP330_54 [uncultured Caudovirales phage]|uniref:Uncharacterized protein n=1 Tax=uncultured Caudovirales phage TaxID=2100421 RepID=A0A6J5LWH1_9CAUD|nr:hypothetical protein UFOVP330_54 [uncultured Caudovirales phage]
MTTSGSRDFNLDVAEIIEEAYERCGLELRTGYDAQTARRSLNLMLAEWANRGLNLWTVAQATIPLVVGTTSYTLAADVIDLLDVVVRSQGTDYEVERISRTEYFTLPEKTTPGRPSQYFLERGITPTIYLWAAPDSATDQIRYYYVRRMQDADTLTNTTEIPFRFLPCMVAGLAYYLALKRAPERIEILKAVYEEEFQRAANEDEDRVSLKLTP